MELHIFDFDGTIFYSPTPSERLKTSIGKRLHGKLLRPLQDGGLGWFQSPTTLLPPAVPQAPSKEWYVLPVLQRLAELKKKKSAAAEMGSQDNFKVYVLTGRDEKHRARIEELLAHAGVRDMMSEVLLKPHETYGTVKFKLESFYRLIALNKPKHVYYYEDRHDQGYKLLSGIRLLSFAVHPNVPESFYVYCASLDGTGETQFFNPVDGTSKGPSAAVVRWWDETRRRTAPDPVSSIVPFAFTMFFLDPALASNGESLLPSNVETDLVTQLRYEKEAYDAAHPFVRQKSDHSFGRK